MAGAEAGGAAAGAVAVAEAEDATAGAVVGAVDPVVGAAGAEAAAGAVSEAVGTEAVAGATTEAGGAVGGAEAEAGAAVAGAASSWRDAEPEPWWAVIDSSTEDGVGGAVELEEVLGAFAMAVEVAGAEGNGRDPGFLCGVEGQGEERQGLQDEDAGSAGGAEGTGAGSRSN